MSGLQDILCGSFECEEWDAEGLSPEEVMERYGSEAEKAYINWIYLNLK